MKGCETEHFPSYDWVKVTVFNDVYTRVELRTGWAHLVGVVPALGVDDGDHLDSVARRLARRRGVGALSRELNLGLGAHVHHVVPIVPQAPVR